jgi:RNA polymerase sigma-70 factor, ECF subfamily
MEQGKGLSKELLLDRELLFTSRNTSVLKQTVAQVFELLRDPVYRYLSRVLDNAEEAEDLTQDVFLRLYTCLHKGQAVGNIRAWVFRVAHNLAVDRQRKNVLQPPFDSANWELTRDPSPGAEERILEKEQHLRLKRALAQLSSEEKQCLELRAEGLSYQEIAEIFEMRLPTLVKYLSRIIKKLVREVTYD